MNIALSAIDQAYIKFGEQSGIDWNYILTRDVTFKFPKKSIPCEFINQWLWMRMLDGNLVCTVFKGYAWDGPTVVPDVDGTTRESVIHDAIYQFVEEIMLVFNWSMFKILHLADLLFFAAMAQSDANTVIKYTYFWGVCVAGYSFHVLAKLFK